jgi:hypothetical protein
VLRAGLHVGDHWEPQGCDAESRQCRTDAQMGGVVWGWIWTRSCLDSSWGSSFGPSAQNAEIRGQPTSLESREPSKREEKKPLFQGFPEPSEMPGRAPILGVLKQVAPSPQSGHSVSTARGGCRPCWGPFSCPPDHMDSTVRQPGWRHPASRSSARGGSQLPTTQPHRRPDL